MKWTPTIRQFVEEHKDDDLNRLLLSASLYPEIDIPFAVEQISSRRHIKEKLPGWYANPELYFPSRLSAEQCSSELTAAYKQQLVGPDDTLCDLTGGLGIDSFFFSRQVKEVHYYERYPSYCEAARHNFRTLEASNIEVHEGDATEMQDQIDGISVFYIDPARRVDSNRRVYALQDCEPDLVSLLPSLLKKAPKVIAKISPMADIQQTLSLLPGTTGIHVLSVNNECKELLFVMERDKEPVSPTVYCVNLHPVREESIFTFTLEEEKNAPLSLADIPGNYLYEPNASILKAGAFKKVTGSFPVKKLAVNSHLYTCNKLMRDFPGRVFRLEELIPFHAKTIKLLSKQVPKANITTRNFPLSVEELRQRTGIKDGGDIYLFATTLANDIKVLIRCTKA